MHQPRLGKRKNHGLCVKTCISETTSNKSLYTRNTTMDENNGTEKIIAKPKRDGIISNLNVESFFCRFCRYDCIIAHFGVIATIYLRDVKNLQNLLASSWL